METNKIPLIQQQENILGIPQVMNPIKGIIPVLEVSQKMTTFLSYDNNTASNTVLAGLAATIAKTDFMLTYAFITIIKNAANDAATGLFNILATVNGKGVRIAGIPILTLTAQSETQQITFPIPIKIDKLTAISATTPTFTAGNQSCQIIIGGYFL